MRGFSSSNRSSLLQLLTLPALILTGTAVGCGSNAPESGTGTGPEPGGTTTPPAGSTSDAGAPPPTLDAGNPVTPVVDAGRPAPDAGSAFRYDTCLQTMQCLQAASCYRSACTSACLNESKPDVRDEATALQSCVELNNCSNDFQCIGQKCIAEASACGLAGEGSATCVETLTCAAGCARNDNGCYLGCLGSANPDARQKVQAIIGCALQSGCGSDQSCVFTRCGTEIQACMGS